MQNFCIVKIIDGLLICERFIAYDWQFLLSNHISHLVGYGSFALEAASQWKVAETEHLSITSMEIGSVLEAIEFLLCAADQCQCGMVYADQDSDAAVIVGAYLMRRFGWNAQTVAAFLAIRVQFLTLEPQQMEILKTFEERLSQLIGETLSEIQFNQRFLATYQAKDDDELIIINTIRNLLPLTPPEPVAPREPKEVRINWRRAHHSVLHNAAFSESRVASVKRNSQKKLGLMVALQERRNSATRPSSSSNAMRNMKITQVNLGEELQLTQFKQFSRTSVNDIRAKGNRLKRKAPLRSSTSMTSFGSLTSWTDQMPKKADSKTSMGLSAKSFLENLRGMNCVGNA